jgi:hypothetical protein
MKINLSQRKFLLLNDYLQYGSADMNIFALLQFISNSDNIGNIAFLDAINRSLLGIKNISSREFIRLQNQFDSDYVIVLALANFLSDTWTAPEGFIEALSRYRIVLFSVGVQSQLDEEADIVLSEDAQSILELARKSGTLIGVRGEISHRYLNGLGIESLAIGCPSVHLAPAEITYTTPLEGARICTSNTMRGFHRDISKKVNEFALKYCSGYMLQTESAIMADCMELPNEVINFIANQSGNPHHADLLRNKFFDYGYYNEFPDQWNDLRAWFKQNAKFNYTVDSWRAYASQFDFCIGTRFHGNVMALQAGIPSLIIPVDARVADMAQFHYLPAISFEDFSNIHEISEITPYLNFNDYNQHHGNNQKIYNEFLKANFQ